MGEVVPLRPHRSGREPQVVCLAFPGDKPGTLKHTLCGRPFPMKTGDPAKMTCKACKEIYAKIGPPP